ncbi:LysR family transcriptional regulator, partial [Azotobacter chroococcum]
MERGRLVELLPQLRGRTRPFSVVYAPHRRQSAATRALIDLLTANAISDEDSAGSMFS